MTAAAVLVDTGIWVAVERGRRSFSDRHKTQLITCNRKDFDDIPGLDVHVLIHSTTA